MEWHTQILRSQVASVVRRVAAQHAERCIQGIFDIAEDDKVPPADRLKAYSMVLDRAAGKPTQEIADENYDPSVLMEKLRHASDQAKLVMSSSALPPPSNVVELRPQAIEPPKKLKRRRLVMS